MEFTLVIYRLRITFISRQTHAFSLSFKIDANYSVYSFNGCRSITEDVFMCLQIPHVKAIHAIIYVNFE